MARSIRNAEPVQAVRQCRVNGSVTAKIPRELEILLPIVKHGSQGLLDGVFRLPSGMFADFLRAAKDNLLVRRSHEMGSLMNSWLYFGQTNCGFEQVTNSMSSCSTEIVGFARFPLQRSYVEPANCILHVQEGSQWLQVSNFDYLFLQTFLHPSELANKIGGCVIRLPRSRCVEKTNVHGGNLIVEEVFS